MGSKAKSGYTLVENFLASNQNTGVRFSLPASYSSNMESEKITLINDLAAQSSGIEVMPLLVVGASVALAHYLCSRAMAKIADGYLDSSIEGVEDVAAAVNAVIHENAIASSEALVDDVPVRKAGDMEEAVLDNTLDNTAAEVDPVSVEETIEVFPEWVVEYLSHSNSAIAEYLLENQLEVSICGTFVLAVALDKVCNGGKIFNGTFMKDSWDHQMKLMETIDKSYEENGRTDSFWEKQLVGGFVNFMVSLFKRIFNQV